MYDNVEEIIRYKHSFLGPTISFLQRFIIIFDAEPFLSGKILTRAVILLLFIIIVKTPVLLLLFRLKCTHTHTRRWVLKTINYMAGKIDGELL